MSDDEDKGVLGIREDRYLFRIGWYFADGGDFGAMLGEGSVPTKAPSGESDWEHWMASRTAAQCKPQRDGDGFYWESKSDARKALVAINAAIKLRADKPMPEWAAKALAEGWKPPKGWKP